MSIAETDYSRWQPEGLQRTGYLAAMTTVAILCNISLCAIGILGCCHVLIPSHLGWATLGVAGGSLLFRLAGGQLKPRKWEILCSGFWFAIPTVLGALGVVGHLSSLQIGLGLTITFGLFTLIYYCETGKEIYRTVSNNSESASKTEATRPEAPKKKRKSRKKIKS